MTRKHRGVSLESLKGAAVVIQWFLSTLFDEYLSRLLENLPQPPRIIFRPDSEEGSCFADSASSRLSGGQSLFDKAGYIEEPPPLMEEGPVMGNVSVLYPMELPDIGVFSERRAVLQSVPRVRTLSGMNPKTPSKRRRAQDVSYVGGDSSRPMSREERKLQYYIELVQKKEEEESKKKGKDGAKDEDGGKDEKGEEPEKPKKITKTPSDVVKKAKKVVKKKMKKKKKKTKKGKEKEEHLIPIEEEFSLEPYAKRMKRGEDTPSSPTSPPSTGAGPSKIMGKKSWLLMSYRTDETVPSPAAETSKFPLKKKVLRSCSSLDNIPMSPATPGVGPLLPHPVVGRESSGQPGIASPISPADTQPMKQLTPTDVEDPPQGVVAPHEESLLSDIIGDAQDGAVLEPPVKDEPSQDEKDGKEDAVGRRLSLSEYLSRKMSDDALQDMPKGPSVSTTTPSRETSSSGPGDRLSISSLFASPKTPVNVNGMFSSPSSEHVPVHSVRERSSSDWDTFSPPGPPPSSMHSVAPDDRSMRPKDDLMAFCAAHGYPRPEFQVCQSGDGFRCKITLPHMKDNVFSSSKTHPTMSMAEDCVAEQALGMCTKSVRGIPPPPSGLRDMGPPRNPRPYLPPPPAYRRDSIPSPRGGDSPFSGRPPMRESPSRSMPPPPGWPQWGHHPPPSSMPMHPPPPPPPPPGHFRGYGSGVSSGSVPSPPMWSSRDAGGGGMPPMRSDSGVPSPFGIPPSHSGAPSSSYDSSGRRFEYEDWGRSSRDEWHSGPPPSGSSSRGPPGPPPPLPMPPMNFDTGRKKY
eukprot:TRINITY_DN2663_c0_g2_i1.p1 TRINITY_DN2663_c0_g2~~TRINITY_DN2663_c0_g2_i1.p1  ORF type:complete len:799 (-),score=255.88 TRINITY_DN2663_c0_g2_i1:119-2515(-)